MVPDVTLNATSLHVSVCVCVGGGGGGGRGGKKGYNLNIEHGAKLYQLHNNSWSWYHNPMKSV